LKLDNLLLDENYNLKLADFGFSTPLQGKDNDKLLKTYLGTVEYQAPEMHLGYPYNGSSVDLFSCGVILFLFAKCRHPFASTRLMSDNSGNALDKQYAKIYLNQYDDFWQDKDESISPELKHLINYMIQFHPSLRLTIEEIKAHPWYN
jgi:serine/threonine protein kinase